jgi:hypothetical protein
MIELLADEKKVYHLYDHAIVENENGTYEYVAWDSKSEKLSWIRGEARILGDVLSLTSITAEGEEKSIETSLELRYELQQLPKWDKTKYYCVVIQQYGGLLKYCDTGEFVMKGKQEYEMIKKELAEYKVFLSSE